RRGIRAWMAAPVAAAVLALILLPQLRRMLGSSPAVVQTAPTGQQEEYRRAHDLLTHYYRPKALETAIPMLERIIGQNARFAPAHADLGRANFQQFLQYRDAKYLDAARESSLRALALAPDLASAHVTLGALYAHTDQNDLAAHELDEALMFDRFNAAAYG